MAVDTISPTNNESHMSKYIDVYVELCEEGLSGNELVDAMIDHFDLRALPTLIKFCGDEDFYMHSLFSRFKITSLVRATFNVRSSNYAIDTDFVASLGTKAFWSLNLKQVLKLSTELRYLYPDKFSYLDNLQTRCVCEGAIT